MTVPPPPRFRIVSGQPRLGRGWLAALAAAWLASLVVAWVLATRLAAPELAQARAQLREAERTAAQQQRQLDALSQQVATLTRSDQISRAANTELQSSLA
ncbi:MAG: hypothetical protein C0P65_012940, partial [Lysobacteraceae bacterium]